MPEPLIERFRKAVSAGEFQRASELWTVYAADRLTEVRRGCGDKLPEMRELIEWTRTVAACARAQNLRTLRTRLMEVHAAGAYERVAI